MKSDFYERRANRIEGMRAGAEKARAEGNGRIARADKMFEMMAGTPVLIGHHSEKRHRRDIERGHNDIRKGLELRGKAAELERRADFAESDTAIYSDDPEAAERLREKIAGLRADQEYMKAANRAVRAAYKHGIRETGAPEDIELLIQALKKATGRDHSEAVARAMMTPDFCGRRGFADYQLSNNNANIKRCEQRLATIEAEASAENKEYEIGEARVVESVEDNRLQIFFPGKPSPELRARLKRNGFRWAPSVGAWQRHLNNAARHAVTLALPAAD
jgi:hypothetical protein